MLTSLPVETILDVCYALHDLKDLVALQEASKGLSNIIETHALAIFARVKPELKPHVPKIQNLLSQQDELQQVLSGRQDHAVAELQVPRLINLDRELSRYYDLWTEFSPYDNAHVRFELLGDPSSAERCRFERAFLDIWHVRAMACITQTTEPGPLPKNLNEVSPETPIAEPILQFLRFDNDAVRLARAEDMAWFIRYLWTRKKLPPYLFSILKIEDNTWSTAAQMVRVYCVRNNKSAQKDVWAQDPVQTSTGYWTFLDGTQWMLEKVAEMAREPANCESAGTLSSTTA